MISYVVGLWVYLIVGVIFIYVFVVLVGVIVFVLIIVGYF